MKVLLTIEAVKASLISAEKKGLAEHRSHLQAIYVFLEKRYIASTDGATLFVSKPGLYVESDVKEYNGNNYIVIKREDIEPFIKNLKAGQVEVVADEEGVYLQYGDTKTKIDLLVTRPLPINNIYSDLTKKSNNSIQGVNIVLLDRLVKINKLLDTRSEFKYPTIHFGRKGKPSVAVIGEDKAQLFIVSILEKHVDRNISIYDL